MLKNIKKYIILIFFQTKLILKNNFYCTSIQVFRTAEGNNINPLLVPRNTVETIRGPYGRVLVFLNC